MPPGYQPGGTEPLQGGVPWESTAGSFVGRWFETMTAANFKSREFFAAVARGGNDAMPPVLFSMMSWTVFGLVGAVFYILLLTLFSTALAAIFKSSGLPPSFAAAQLGVGILFAIGFVVVYGIIGFVGPWVTGGLHHLMLLMVSGVGPGREYAHTVRVHAYASAAPLLFGFVPLFGGIVMLAFSIINHVNGYDEMHRCGGGKAFLAWATPVIICCCCYLMMIMMVATVGNM